MEQCVFCGIAKGAIPSKKVLEDEVSFAFLDINPRNPGHTLVIPKKHHQDIFDIPPEDAGHLFQSVKKVAHAAMEGMNADGVSISQSNGKAAGQMVPHLHFHVIPRFLNEGPAGLESMLPGKRMDDAALSQVADAIQSTFHKKAQRPEPRDEFSF
jgi:histidine triad (HIT) family protein